MRKRRLTGIGIRVTPDRVRMFIPIHHAEDLPQIARQLRKLADQLDLAFMNETTREQKVADAYWLVRNFDKTLQRELPK